MRILRPVILPFAILAFGALASCERKQEADTDAPAVESTGASFEQYSAAQFFETTSFSMVTSSGHAFSAKNGDLLISSDESGVYNAYRMSTKDGTRVAMTSSTTNATFARSWFPNDDRIIYTADVGGNELDHVFVLEEDGTTKDLTPGERHKAFFAGWAADGGSFFISLNERNPQFFDLYRVDAATYKTTLIFENPGFQLGAISSDGRYVVLSKANSSADSDLYVVDLADEMPSPTLITEHEGAVSHRAHSFTPDNGSLIYGTDEHSEFSEAWAYNLSTGERAPYLNADWDVSFVSFSPSGRIQYSGVNADARTVITLRDLETGNKLALPDMPSGNLSQVRFTRDETKLGLVLSGSRAPGNIIYADLEKGTATQLTNALNPAIDAAHLVEAEVTRFKSYDELDIPGILYKPRQASADTPVPAVVFVHGGPGGQSGVGYSAMIQHLVNHGYAIYAINNRGSSGYGKTFYHLDDKRHGDADLKDVVHSRQYLAAMDWIDGSRVGVMGGSYGGYMVAAALAFEPEAFDVGIDIFGVTNWLRTLENIPPWWGAFRDALYDEMGDPATDRDRLHAISPLFHAQNIVKPLLVVQGANDPRVLQVESDEIVEKVRANGVPVEYIVFPDEGHGFRNRANRITASDAYLTFLNQYLKGE